MTTIDAVRDPHRAVVLQILSPRSSSLRSGPSLALERGFPAASRNELKDGCTTLKWNRWRDVGQAGSLRATQRVPRLPPLSAAIAAVGRLTIGRSLPSCPTGAPAAWRTTYAQMQALLLMNRVDVHFQVAHPSQTSAFSPADSLYHGHMDPLLRWRSEFPILGHTVYMISH